MKYYAQYNESNKLIAIGTGYGGVEITEEEYNRLLTEIREKTLLADKLYSDEITLNDIPTEWQEEIQQRVNERIEALSKTEEQPISSDEFYSMLEEVL